MKHISHQAIPSYKRGDKYTFVLDVSLYFGTVPNTTYDDRAIHIVILNFPMDSYRSVDNDILYRQMFGTNISDSSKSQYLISRKFYKNKSNLYQGCLIRQPELLKVLKILCTYFNKYL